MELSPEGMIALLVAALLVTIWHYERQLQRVERRAARLRHPSVRGQR